MAEPEIIETRRFSSPARTPQALAWDGNVLWMGSRDLRRIYAIDPKKGTVLEEREAPGIPWAAVSTNGTLRFTIGEGPDDDRYIRTYDSASGFGEDRIACPEFTGSYLSFDGDHLYLSQWYKHRILKLDAGGNLRPRVCRWLDLHPPRKGTAKRGLAHRASRSTAGHARSRRYRCCPVRVSLTDFRWRTLLVELSRKGHDYFIRSSELKTVRAGLAVNARK